MLLSWSKLVLRGLCTNLNKLCSNTLKLSASIYIYIQNPINIFHNPINRIFRYRAHELWLFNFNKLHSNEMNVYVNSYTYIRNKFAQNKWPVQRIHQINMNMISSIIVADTMLQNPACVCCRDRKNSLRCSLFVSLSLTSNKDLDCRLLVCTSIQTL